MSENDEDGRFRKAFASPASKETILAHLMKATISLPIKGTNKDSPEEGAMQTMLIINDTVEHLLDAKVTEVDLFIALYQLADTEEFFPSISKIKKRLK